MRHDNREDVSHVSREREVPAGQEGPLSDREQSFCRPEWEGGAGWMCGWKGLSTEGRHAWALVQQALPLMMWNGKESFLHYT